MTVVYVILAVVILALIFLLCSKIKLFFEYKKYPGEKLYTDFSVYLGLINVTGFIKKPSEDKLTKKAKEKITAEKIENYAKTLKILAKVYSKNRWHIQFWLFDAMQTGIMTGALWSFLYSALALADAVGTVKDHFFEVAPVYTEPGFISQGSIKLSIRVINALTIMIRLYFTYRKITKVKK